MTKPGDAIREQLRALLKTAGVSYSELCRRLTADTPKRPWRISRVSKMLNGRIPLTVDDLVRMADAAGVSLVEIVRQRGREFVADLTPSEMLLLQKLRANPKAEKPLLEFFGIIWQAPVPPRPRLVRTTKAEFWAPEAPPTFARIAVEAPPASGDDPATPNPSDAPTPPRGRGRRRTAG